MQHILYFVFCFDLLIRDTSFFVYFFMAVSLPHSGIQAVLKFLKCNLCPESGLKYKVVLKSWIIS